MVPGTLNTHTTMNNQIYSVFVSSGSGIASTDDNTTSPVMVWSRGDDPIGTSGGDYVRTEGPEGITGRDQI